jgi:NADH-quinone oxidoreductase subunit M
VVLAGVLLKMGTYGFLRFLLPIAPDATKELMPWFMTLALIGVIYGALVAMIQKDMKKLVAYSSVSHLGLCMLGIFALNPNGITGGILQMLNHGISTSALFLIVGIVYERRHTRLIAEYGGLSKTMPLYATVFLVMTMSSIGLPGLNGFIGEFAILQGAFQAAPWLAVAATTGIILGAAYMLWLYQRAMFGPINETNTKMADLNAREIAYFVPLLIAAFWIGLYPKPLLAILDKPVEKLVMQVNPNFYKQQPLTAAQREAAKAGMAAMAAPAEAHGEAAAPHGEAEPTHGGH